MSHLSSMLTQSCQRKSAIWKPWLICLSAGLFFFYVFFQLNVFDVINQPLRNDFLLNAAQLSWMSSTFVWANVLFLLPAGFVLDRYSARNVILWAMLVCVLGTLGFACTHAWAWASFFHGLTGASNAFCFLSCIVLVSRWFEPRRWALVMGCIVTMAFLGGMVAHTPLAYLNEQYGWRHAVFMDAAVGGVLLVWIFFVVREAPNARVVLKQKMPWWQTLCHVLVRRQNACAGLYTACLNLPIIVLCALWGASYLRVVHQETPLVASSIISFIFIGSIIGCPMMGWLSDRWGRRKPLMILSAVLTLLFLLPLTLGWSLSSNVLRCLFLGLGFFTSAQVISYPLIAESNPPAQTGLATSVASIIIMGVGGVGQVLFGHLMQHPVGWGMPADTTFDFQRAMWLFPIAIMVALVMTFLIKEPSRGRDADG